MFYVFCFVFSVLCFIFSVYVLFFTILAKYTAATAPKHCAITYPPNSKPLILLLINIDKDTTGFTCAPDIFPTKYIAANNATAIGIGSPTIKMTLIN